MTTLTWNKVGERTYESGVDRGVLFVPGQPAVVWNGLISVAETPYARETKAYYMDGIKYLDYHVVGEFSGKLKAFTFPDEVNVLVGNMEYVPGVFFHDQPPKPFGLSYRTGVGNDLEGSDYGYKIHLLYNVMAEPSDVQHDSFAQIVTPNNFEWTLTTTPPNVYEMKPTSHISIHSSSVDPLVLQAIEDLIYGTASSAPQLPTFSDLVTLIDTLS